MGKLEQYAKRLKANAERAQAYIGELENAGFTVPDNIKNIVQTSLNSGNRITKATYDKAMISLNKNRIKSTAKINFTEFHDPYNSSRIITADKESLPLSKLVNDINKRMKKASGDEILEGDIQSAIQLLKGKVVAGETNQYYSISPNYNPKKDYLQDVVTFKQLPPIVIKNLLRSTRLSQAGEEAYNYDWHHRSYNSLVKNIDSLKNIKPSTLGKLEVIMNSSQAWNVAKKGMEYESKKNAKGWKKGEVRDNWEQLFNAVEKVKDDDTAFDKVVTMIENEEDFETILDYVNDIIANGKKEN